MTHFRKTFQIYHSTAEIQTEKGKFTIVQINFILKKVLWIFIFSHFFGHVFRLFGQIPHMWQALLLKSYRDLMCKRMTFLFKNRIFCPFSVLFDAKISTKFDN